MSEWIPVCQAADLLEGGLAVPFDVVYAGQTCRAFAVRHEGQVQAYLNTLTSALHLPEGWQAALPTEAQWEHAYLNRCTHVAMELDFQPDRFFDTSGQWLMCATHGATYSPATGACTGGPCRGGLVKITLAEQGGVVHWHTEYNLKPFEF